MRLVLLACAALFVVDNSIATPSTPSPASSEHRTLRRYQPIDIDVQEFEAFLDEFITTRMEREHVPGVVFYMVKDGKPFLAKGYGYADIEKNMPMDPHQTVLAVGSLTKLFTATACMQLVEQDKLELFADVNTYLDAFKVPSQFDQPITLAHLLEHTDGFDVAHIGVATRDPDAIIPLERYLARHLPERVRPPGMSAVYGEHGMTLAGYLIECVTDMTYVEYMRSRILKPLGMTRSDFRIRPDMQDNVCRAYSIKHGALVPVEPELAYHIQPAAGLYATAHDLGQFLLAHLEVHQTGEPSIFSPETGALMFQQKFGLHPMLSAWSYGFHSRLHAGELCIEHGGMSLRSISQMLMMPERGIGFVIVGNTISMRLHKEFHNAFLTRYFGARSELETFDPDAPGVIDPQTFEGWYASLHRSISTLERLSDTSRQTHVKVTSPTTLRTNSTFDHVTWHRITQDVYESEDGEARIAFVRDETGQVVAMLNGPHECVRLRWWETIPVHRAMFAAVAAVLFTGTIAPLVTLVAKRRTHVAPARATRDIIASIVIWSVCTLNITFIFGLGYVLRTTNHLEFVFGLPLRMELLLWLPIITTALAPAVAGFAITAWVDGHGSVLKRMHQTTIAVAAMAFIALASYWNLIGFNV